MDHAQITILATIAASYFAAALVPGPSSITVMRSSLAGGQSCGLAAAAGVALGNSIYAAVAAFGLALVIKEAGAAFLAIKLAGGAYLIYLGLRMAFNRGRAAVFADKPATARLGRFFRRALLTDLSNPKTIMAFLGIFAIAFPAHPTHELSLAVTGTVGLISLSWHSLLAHLFARPILRQAYHRLGRWIDRIAGGLISLFGVAVAATSL
ncbi:MAG: LysE family transporter [Dongiaceae bacterium]